MRTASALLATTLVVAITKTLIVLIFTLSNPTEYDYQVYILTTSEYSQLDKKELQILEKNEIRFDDNTNGYELIIRSEVAKDH